MWKDAGAPTAQRCHHPAPGSIGVKEIDGRPLLCIGQAGAACFMFGVSLDTPAGNAPAAPVAHSGSAHSGSAT